MGKTCLSAVLIFASFQAFADCGSHVSEAKHKGATRYGENNLLVSAALPEIRVRLGETFVYVGKIDFAIRDVARGERYIFVEAENQRIVRMFIGQFEGFLPTNNETYRYSFDDALVLSGHRFRQNTYAFSNREATQENPKGEAALTSQFLRSRGYTLGDELMMSRFVTVPDEAKRHELILFYVEDVERAGHQLHEFYENGEETAVWIALSEDLTTRSLAAFAVE